ncbi:MAG: leucyl aminopeptidase [Acidimicrobiales bacterium]|nr:leucyl aminopeptidase [Acidimicrobiales bacterium]
MPIMFNAVRSVPKATKARIRLVTSQSVEAGLSEVADGQLDSAGFSGKAGETHVYLDGKRTEILIGMGGTESVTPAAVRNAGAGVARKFGRYGKIGVELPDTELDGAAARTALVEGLSLGAYTFLTYKSDGKASKLMTVEVAGGNGAKSQAACDRGAVIARGQMLARDLVNEPGGSLTPPVFARRASAMAKEQGLAVKVWDEAAIKKGKLGGLLGVNRGSTNPPRLVELTYTPKGKSNGFLALVGKGITFDAGGLSIKTGQGMMTMKCDMGGAAAVVGAMSVLKDLQVPCKVRAWIPMTDNMLGGDATRPGDVLKIRNGKTIEVLNTDAEGRLVLADGLSLASEAKPDAIVDLATLTGACMVALGPKIAGLMSNNDAWVEQIEAASSATGERVWHLPLPDDYMRMCDSPIADMKNIGGSHGGALTAGLILQQFVGDGIPWAHLDIAGPAFTDAEDGEWSKGGTGFGVRLLADLASNFQKPA